jgi:hypothetical protein
MTSKPSLLAARELAVFSETLRIGSTHEKQGDSGLQLWIMISVTWGGSTRRPEKSPQQMLHEGACT